MLEILTINIADQHFDKECINKDAEWNDNPRILNKLGELERYEETLGIDLRDLLRVLTGSIFVNTELGIYELNGSMCYIDKKRQALCCYFDAHGKFLPFKDYGTYWSANREDVVKWRKENGWE